MRYFPEDQEDEPEETKYEDFSSDTVSSLRKCYSTEALSKAVQSLNDDLDDLIVFNIYQKDENRRLAMKKAITALESHLKSLIEVKPVYSISDDVLRTLKVGVEYFLEDSVKLEKPIRAIRISNCYFDSKILMTMKQHDQIKEWVDLNTFGNMMQLAYRGSTHGLRCVNFHSAVGKSIPTLVIVKTVSGRLFGGFTDGSWAPKPVHKNTLFAGTWKTTYRGSTRSFLFSLDSGVKMPIDPVRRDKAIYVDRQKGPCFGNEELWIVPNDDTEVLKKVVIKPGGVYRPENDESFVSKFLGENPGDDDCLVQDLEVFNFFF